MDCFHTSDYEHKIFLIINFAGLNLRAGYATEYLAKAVIKEHCTN